MYRLGPVFLLNFCAVVSVTLLCNQSFAAIEPAPAGSAYAALPDAPSPGVNLSEDAEVETSTGKQFPAHGGSLSERILNAVDPGYLDVGDKWDVTINRGEKVRPFTRADKIKYAGVEELSPFTLFDISWSAGYEQLRNSNPKFGSDKAGFGERLGAAAFRQGTYRLLGDGVFPALLHQDPRYYRIADGSVWYRGVHSADQVLISHNDNGTRGINYSSIAGEAVANTLPLTFYPQTSVKASVALSGFGFSLLDDAALKLTREFLPDLFRAAKLIPAE